MNISPIPHHIAIIPDGNRRWAKKRHLPAFMGHQSGLETFVKVAKASRKLGVHTLTFWAFSTENWKRDADEINNLMKLLERAIETYSKDLHEDQVRLIHIGRKDRLPTTLKRMIETLEKETHHYDQFVLNIGLDYGGRDELIRAIKTLNEQKKEITEETVSSALDTGGQSYPNPDLLIRTSGELRTSGLMPWQTVYTEFYSEPDHFPEFNEEKLITAMEAYANRQRRFGGN